MLFSSWQFILVFLPIAFLGYFGLNHLRLLRAGKLWLVLVSLFFYAYWNAHHLPLLLVSILFNYVIGTRLARGHRRWSGETSALPAETRRGHDSRQWLLAFGIAANLALLGYYKYAGFLVENLNALSGSAHPAPHIVLPLAISFFTFTQIVYLVDSHRGETADYDLLNYALFVTFFPHLIAGPIVQHSQIMPQFASRWTLSPRQNHLAKGMFIFSLGLFKKVVIADGFSGWADAGFDGGQALGFYEAWGAVLAYTFQLYFDFSGYCDMAVGASLLFNIRLPINFDSPYKALDIQDFWRRWHITLSHFLRDHVYIPLGGNRFGVPRTWLNIFITFVLGGLWHGASWMFVIWGALHGGALVIHRVWQRVGRPLPRPFAWTLTFGFVCVAWVFFRARTMDDAFRVLRGMADLSSAVGGDVQALPTADLAWGGVLIDGLLRILPAGLVGQLPTYFAIALAFAIVSRRNVMALAYGRIDTKRMIAAGVLFAFAMYVVIATTSVVFLYFNF